jgi:hypothetical protein
LVTPPLAVVVSAIGIFRRDGSRKLAIVGLVVGLAACAFFFLPSLCR